MRRIFLAASLLFAMLNLGACQSDEPARLKPPIVRNPNEPGIPTDPGVPGPDAVKILFVGNSLTYYNDLPALVTAQARTRGANVHATQLTFPNYALEDHWNDGEMQRMIRNNDYDYVVVQQGPSSQADGREMLHTFGLKIAEICREVDTKLAFYMVWPARANLHTFNGVINNYRDAALASGAILCPVGLRWKEYFDLTGDFSYYGSDNFHPSPLGSQVAATIIAESLFP